MNLTDGRTLIHEPLLTSIDMIFRPLSFLFISMLFLFGCSGPKNPERAKELEKKAVQHMVPPQEVDSAIHLLQKAIKLDSTNRTLYSNLITAYRGKKDHKAALNVIEIYQERKKEKDLQFMMLRAANQYCRGKEKQGIKTLKKTLELANERIDSRGMDRDLLSNKIDVLFLLGRRKKAEKLIEKKKKEFPDEHAEFENFEKMEMEEFGTSVEKGIGKMCDR